MTTSPTNFNRAATIGLGLLSFRSLFLAACFYLVSCDRGVISVHDETVSPDGKMVATVYSAEGGGAAGWTRSNVELRRSGTPFGTGRDLLKRRRGYGSLGRIKAGWEDRTTLKVTAWFSKDHLEDLRTGPEVYEGVRIVYEVIPWKHSVAR